MKIELVDEQLRAIVVAELKAMIGCLEVDMTSLLLGEPPNVYVYGHEIDAMAADFVRIKEQIKAYKMVLEDFTTEDER